MQWNKYLSWKIPRNIITFQTFQTYLSHVECWHILVWCIYEVWQMYTSIQPYKKGFEWENVILSLSIFLLLLSMPLSLYFTVQSMHILPCLKSRAPIKGEQGVHMYPPTFSAPPALKIKLKTQSTHPECQVFPSTQPKNQFVSNWYATKFLAPPPFVAPLLFSCNGCPCL